MFINPIPKLSPAIVQSIAALANKDILKTVPTQTTLNDLAAVFGISRATLALGVGVDPRLFELVDKRRQPLPRIIATRLAKFLNTNQGTIELAAGFLTVDSSESSMSPLPPDPFQGDGISTTPVAPTKPVVRPPASFTSQLVYAVDVLTNKVFRINRHSGAVDSLGTLAMTGPYDLVMDAAGKLWTGASGSNAVARLNANPYNDDFETTSFYNRPKYLAFEPKGRTLWACDQNDNLVIQVQLDTGNGLGFLSVQLSLTNATPHAIVAPGDGFLYAVATTGSEGRVIKIDPTVPSYSVSTGTNLGTNTRCLAYDPATDAFFVTQTLAASKISKVPRTTLVAVDFTVDQAFLSSVAEQITVAAGNLYISDFVSARSKVHKYTNGGTFVVSKQLSGSSKPGHLVYDGAFLWVANPSAAQIVKLNPVDPLLGTVMTVSLVSTQPEGMVVV